MKDQRSEKQPARDNLDGVSFPDVSGFLNASLIAATGWDDGGVKESDAERRESYEEPRLKNHKGK